ncbi:MAG: DUF4329 domain-containing protein [Roseovarius sp.]
MRHILALVLLTALVACEEADVYSPPIQGPKTKNADVFAKAFLDQMQARSFAANREFCGIFGRDADGYVIATAPILGELDTCRPPVGGPTFNAFASYHSHGAFDYPADAEVPSTYDVLADRAEKVVGYISTPGGRVWRTDNGVARQICGVGCIQVDPNFEPQVFGPVYKRYTLDQLRRREEGL